MDIDAMNAKLARLAKFEPMLEEMWPRYQKHKNREAADKIEAAAAESRAASAARAEHAEKEEAERKKGVPAAEPDKDKKKKKTVEQKTDAELAEEAAAAVAGL